METKDSTKKGGEKLKQDVKQVKGETTILADKKPRKKLKWYVVLAIVLGVVLAVVLFFVFANKISSNNLLKFIDSFDAVNYKNQINPTIDKDGYYTFTTDNDFKVMQFTDLHIGGGLHSQNQDKKVIYELICMLQQEKPDLVVLTGDNVFAVPGPIYNGGGTLNNLMVSKVVLEIFEHEKVYFTTTFGNHDTEVFDYYSRKQLADLYSSDEYKYCIFNQDFVDQNSNMQSMTNQCILVKNTSHEISKAIMLLDSNAYVDNSIKAVLDWNYDVIHNEQVEWAYNTLKSLKVKNNNNVVKSLFFFHIPIGEYEEAYRELKGNNFDNTENAEYISGTWDEIVDEDLGGRIWYGGCSNKDKSPADCDNLFERLGPSDLNSMEACFCGHDHTNNAVVKYKGVLLSYSNSMDNLAYSDLCYYGAQRGCTVISIKNDGTWSQEHKFVYTDYEVDANQYYQQKDGYYYKDYLPNN